MIKLIKYLRHYKKESIIGPLFKLLEACFELIVPLIMARIIDVGIQNRDLPYILKMVSVLVSFGVLGLACSLTAQYFAAKAAVGFGTELRHDLFLHIEGLSYSEIDKAGSSTLVTRRPSDINQGAVGSQSGTTFVPSFSVYCSRSVGHGMYDQYPAVDHFFACHSSFVNCYLWNYDGNDSSL